MPQIQEALSQRIRTLQSELHAVAEEQERAFGYRWSRGKARFEREALVLHQNLRRGLISYFLDSRILAILSAPIIYIGVVPFALLDLFLYAFQTICFPIYGIPKVKRGDYFVFDRGRLKYLNVVERLNCIYCSYGNGLFAFATEVAARTEQHWCPVKHAARLRAPHSRYAHFLDYGDAENYQRQVEGVRKNFVDVRDVKEAKTASRVR